MGNVENVRCPKCDGNDVNRVSYNGKSMYLCICGHVF